MSDKKLIKQEIERLYKHYLDAQEFDCGYNMALDAILQFIDSLEEPACADLEEEINRVDDWYPVELKYIQEIAHHFAEWQKTADEKLFKDDSWSYIEENYPNITQEEKLRLYDISIKSKLAGANTIKQQMMKDAISCNVDWYDGFRLDYTQEQQDDLLLKLGVDVGNRVRVIIIKEN